MRERTHACSCPASSVPRCKQCSNTLHSGAYQTTAKPGVFICSSHHPTPASASPRLLDLAPRQAGAVPTDSKPPSTPQKAQEAFGRRDAWPEARTAAWEPVVGNSTAKSFIAAAADPLATTSPHVPIRSPAGPRLAVGPLGSKASMRVTNNYPTGWSSLAQDTAAVSPRPAVTQSAPDPCPATPQGQATPRLSAPQTKPSLSPASSGPADTPAWTPSASRTQQARERFFQTPAAAPTTAVAGRAPAPAQAPSGVGSREQALSCLRKALPVLVEACGQAPGRCVGRRGWGCGPTCPAATGAPGGLRDCGWLGRIPSCAPSGCVTMGLHAPASVSSSGKWGE